ncbi:MAG: nuclear transport factor 2 family protein [Chitinophagaceae bacterium]|nr:nuclear transport factor 2 family protein [Chitinophagaceae bacterium]
MKKSLFIGLSFLISTLVLAQSSGDAQVWNRVEALSKAIFETKDSIALLDLVSTKVSYGHSGGNIEDKPTMVQKAVASKTTYKNNALERVSVDIDGNTAIVRHNFRATSVENGTETPLNLAILQVWKKEKGIWRIWARQAVKILPKS